MHASSLFTRACTRLQEASSGEPVARSLLPETLAVSTEVPTPWGDAMSAVSSVTLILTWVPFLVSSLLVLNACGQSFHRCLSWY